MFEEIVKILSNFTEVKPEDMKPESDLRADLKLESVSYFAIIFEIEEKYGIEVSDEDAMKIHTIGDIVEYLEKNIA